MKKDEYHKKLYAQALLLAEKNHGRDLTKDEHFAIDEECHSCTEWGFTFQQSLDYLNECEEINPS